MPRCVLPTLQRPLPPPYIAHCVPNSHEQAPASPHSQVVCGRVSCARIHHMQQHPGAPQVPQEHPAQALAHMRPLNEARQVC